MRVRARVRESGLKGRPVQTASSALRSSERGFIRLQLKHNIDLEIVWLPPYLLDNTHFKMRSTLRNGMHIRTQCQKTLRNGIALAIFDRMYVTNGGRNVIMTSKKRHPSPYHHPDPNPYPTPNPDLTLTLTTTLTLILTLTLTLTLT